MNSPMTPPRPSEVPTCSVLLVDDEPHVLAALRRHLRGPWTLHCATSATEGHRLLEQHRCSIVVSDLHMPAIDGIAFFEELHRSHPETLRIMLTGDVDRTAVIRAVNQGHIFRFLNKPCPPEAIRLALDDALEIHQLRESQRLLQEQKLADAARLARAGQLAGTVATALDQVIRLVASNAAFAHSQATDPNLAHTILTIERVLAHGRDLTRQLTKACADPAAAAPAPATGPGPVLNHLLPLLHQTVGPEVPIEFRCDSDLDCGPGGADVLGQIAAGLIQHARTLAPGRSRFRVALSTVEISDRRARLHSGLTPGVYTVLEITNVAGGSTRKTAESQYRPLLSRETADGDPSSVLHEIARTVAQHHGWIQIRSDVDRGTSVLVYLHKPERPDSAQHLEAHDIQA